MSWRQKESDGPELLVKYKHYLWDKLKRRHSPARLELFRLARQGDAHLGCYCKPQDCHGDLIRKAIEWIIEKDIQEYDYYSSSTGFFAFNTVRFYLGWMVTSPFIVSPAFTLVLIFISLVLQFEWRSLSFKMRDAVYFLVVESMSICLPVAFFPDWVIGSPRFRKHRTPGS
jgi:hypothetical protein